MNAIYRKYFLSKSITSALFLAMILFFVFSLFDFLIYFSRFRFLFLSLVNLKSPLFALTTLLKKCRIPFIFSIFGSFIYFHAFVLTSLSCFQFAVVLFVVCQFETKTRKIRKDVFFAIMFSSKILIFLSF